MIVSPLPPAGRGYVFVHIPKTGGTALALALEARAGKNDLLIGDTPKARRRHRRLHGLSPAGRLWKHSTLADIEGIVARAAFGHFTIFSIVRNPWDRIVSYYHWLREQEFGHPAVALARAGDFSAFLNAPLTQGALRANPFSCYLRDGAGVERDALWLRLEEIEAGLDQLAPRIGFRPEMGVANRSGRARDWRGFYSAADAALLADLCAEDIARFGYRF